MHEAVLACLGIQGVGLEAKARVTPHRRGIACKDFKGQLAAAKSPGLTLNSNQQGLPNTLATAPRKNDNVMDVEQRFGLESGVAEKRIDQANGFRVWSPASNTPSFMRTITVARGLLE
ncbi:hypothetical protein MASR1M60_19090 [Rhodocyclaceae bacterium]